MTFDPSLPPITAIPEAPASSGVPPRGRGRPPKLNPDGTRMHPSRASKSTRDRGPKRAGGAPGSTPARPRVSSLKTRIGAQLTTLSMLVSVIPPLAPDALSPQEIELLADGIDKQCQQSPRFRRYVEQALGATGAGGLVAAVAIIAARRASRHNILPPMVDPMLGALIGESLNQPITNTDSLRASAEAQQIELNRAEPPIEPEPTIPWGAPGPPVEQPSNSYTPGDFNYETGEQVAS